MRSHFIVLSLDILEVFGTEVVAFSDLFLLGEEDGLSTEEYVGWRFEEHKAAIRGHYSQLLAFVLFVDEDGSYGELANPVHPKQFQLV